LSKILKIGWSVLKIYMLRKQGGFHKNELVFFLEKKYRFLLDKNLFSLRKARVNNLSEIKTYHGFEK